MRVFVAIDLPEEIKEEINMIAEKLVKKIPLRRVVRENLHITLVFLGEQSEEGIEKVKKTLDPIIKLFPSFNLSIKSPSVFPDNKKPRGIWYNFGGEKEKAFSLYKKVIDGLLAQSIKLDERNFDFSLHCTIGRFREKVKFPGNLDKKLEGYEINKDLTVKKVVFFESKLSPEGPEYSKLAEFSLKLT